MEQRLRQWLARFGLDQLIESEVVSVLLGLPEHVRRDIVEDEGFCFYDYEPGPRVVMCVPVSAPGANGHSRSVVLKRTLRRATPAFTRYIIAHELAHAFLRNAGRWDGDDPERAAEELAAQWGFPRPG